MAVLAAGNIADRLPRPPVVQLRHDAWQAFFLDLRAESVEVAHERVGPQRGLTLLVPVIEALDPAGKLLEHESRTAALDHDLSDAGELALGRSAVLQLVESKTGGVECGPRLVQDLRSEEHTSELQSLMRISYAVFCLQKKKIKIP